MRGINHRHRCGRVFLNVFFMCNTSLNTVLYLKKQPRTFSPFYRTESWVSPPVLISFMTATGVLIIVILISIVCIGIRTRSSRSSTDDRNPMRSLNISEPYNLQHSASASNRTMTLVPRHMFMPMGTMAAEIAYDRDRMSHVESNLASGMQEDMTEIPAPIVNIDDV